jgi:hypothetical protein
MDRSRIAKWLRQSVTDVAATPTRPFLENSDLVLLLASESRDKDVQNVCMQNGSKSKVRPVRPSEVPRMPIRVTVPRELASNV